MIEMTDHLKERLGRDTEFVKWWSEWIDIMAAELGMPRDEVFRMYILSFIAGWSQNTAKVAVNQEEALAMVREMHARMKKEDEDDEKWKS